MLTRHELMTLRNVDLALALNDVATSRPDLVKEAATRVTRLAMISGECECIMVHQAHVEFHRVEPMSCKVGANDRPVPFETMSVRYLEPGECRAVNRFGTVVIVERASAQPREET